MQNPQQLMMGLEYYILLEYHMLSALGQSDQSLMEMHFSVRNGTNRERESKKTILHQFFGFALIMCNILYKNQSLLEPQRKAEN